MVEQNIWLVVIVEKDCSKRVFKYNPHAKMGIPDLQSYPLKLCLIKYALNINV